MTANLPPLEDITFSGRVLPPDQLATLRIAAYFFFAQVGLGILMSVFLGVPTKFVELIIYLLLAFYLYWPNRATRAVTLFLAILTAVLRSNAFFSKLPAERILALSTSGLAISLLVLLLGHATRTRRIAAICIFGLSSAVVLTLAILQRFSR
jgi:hypothetical protein